MKAASIKQIIEYEVGASWWAALISDPWLQSLASRYFARKTRKKYNRYIMTKEVVWKNDK